MAEDYNCQSGNEENFQETISVEGYTKLECQ